MGAASGNSPEATAGIALMLILLVLTFAGTLHQVRLSSSMGPEAAIESFFGAPYVLIPLGGENSLVSLPLPGMGITCALLFANLLIGGVPRPVDLEARGRAGGPRRHSAAAGRHHAGQ